MPNIEEKKKINQIINEAKNKIQELEPLSVAEMIHRLSISIEIINKYNKLDVNI